MSEIKPIPLPRREFVTKFVEPYLPQEGQVIAPKTFNRGEKISLRDDTSKNISIGLEDHDSAVQYYFNNVIKPNVIQNGIRNTVPVIVASPERFKSVQIDGFYRDKNGKIMVPLITFKRESFTKNRNLGNKLDGNYPQNIQIFEQRYNKRNIYDNFSQINNIIPQVSRIVTVVPDYITLRYSCIVFTNFIEQNNKLLESINYASDSYWGDINRFQFRATIDSFNTPTILEQGDDRVAKSTFDIELNGYLIPDVINKDLSQIQNKVYDKSKIIITSETVSKLL